MTLYCLCSLHQSVSQNPYSVDGWYSLGLVHRESGRARQAEESFSNLLQLSPSHEAGLVELSESVENVMT